MTEKSKERHSLCKKQAVLYFRNSSEIDNVFNLNINFRNNKKSVFIVNNDKNITHLDTK